MNEAERIRERYARRGATPTAHSHPLHRVAIAVTQERQRAFRGLLARAGIASLRGLSIMEVGCGAGRNLVELIMLGASPQKLVGNDLIEKRIAEARRRLPRSVRLDVGDAASLSYPEGQFDIVMQFVVFSSIFDEAFQRQLAERMWAWTKPGGAVLWYDFVYDNPRNPDVRGVPLGRVRTLFPDGEMTVRRVTLAPPLARAAPALYHLFNIAPFLRTHRLCWIRKPADAPSARTN